MSALEVYTPVRVTRSVLTRPEALDVPVGRGTVETPTATVKVKKKDFFFIFNVQQITRITLMSQGLSMYLIIYQQTNKCKLTDRKIIPQIFLAVYQLLHRIIL